MVTPPKEFICHFVVHTGQDIVSDISEMPLNSNKLTNSSIISQVIKMFAWEEPLGKMISNAREMELNILRKNSYVRCLYMTFAIFTTRMALFCTMLSMCLMYGNENITAARVDLIVSEMRSD